MDTDSINAVEDYRPMGLERDAGALLVAQPDAPGAARAEEIAVMEAACAAAGGGVSVTDDPDEGELFVEARRLAFADSARRADLAFGEVMRAAIELGGTITGEHGVGRAKMAALPDQLGPDVMALSQRWTGPVSGCVPRI